MAAKKTAKKVSNKIDPKPVLVTTEHRGVFFGFLASVITKEKVTLSRVRNVVYWSADAKGFLGLASNGPPHGCRVGPAAPKSDLFDITSVTQCTPEAVERFEAAPWT